MDIPHRLLGWLARRSLRLLHALGGVLGWAGYLLSASYRQRLRTNAALAGIGPAERRAAVADAGRLVMELPRLWLRPRHLPIADPVHWDGAEIVEDLLAQGRGLVFLTPHLGSFEVAAQAYAERFGARQPVTVLYRPARQPWLRELEETARARPALATAPASLAGVRQMMRALRRGETVGLLPDQVPPVGMGVWAPFFGLPRGGGYLVHAMALPEPLPENGGDEAAAAAINRCMEAVIRLKPTQYLWGYHRYKSPRGAATGAGAP